MPLEDKSVVRVHSTQRQATDISLSSRQDQTFLFQTLEFHISNMKLVDMNKHKKDATS